MTSTTTTSEKPFTVCVFCGASPGSSPAFIEAAEALAEQFHANSWSLVYGGGTVGLMGAVSKRLVSLSGPDSVHGIIPEALMKFEQKRPGGSTSADASATPEVHNLPPVEEFGHTEVVKTMHERKHKMAHMANAFVALPGGYGTMEELFEIITWNQLGIHDRPIVLFNVDGFYDGILSWIKDAVEKGFVRASLKDIVVEAKSAEEAVRRIKKYKVPEGRYNLAWEDSEAK